MLDFQALQASAAYADFTPDSPIICWLWEVVQGFTVEYKRKFLHFVTGSDRVPIKGLGELTIVIQVGNTYISGGFSYINKKNYGVINDAWFTWIKYYFFYVNMDIL
jgi:hypothetical protein